MVNKFKTISDIKAELEKLTDLEEKRIFLEKLLKQIKDKKLREDVEKILNEIKLLLSKKTTSKMPSLESLMKPTKSELEEIAISSKPKFTEEKAETLLEKYTTSAQTLEKEELVKPVEPLTTYKLRLEYIPQKNRETIHDIVMKYLRSQHIEPEDIIRSPQLRQQAVEKAYELLGKTVDRYSIEQQIFYEAEKAEYPNFVWERDPEGFIKYKPLKTIKPKLIEEG